MAASWRRMERRSAEPMLPLHREPVEILLREDSTLRPAWIWRGPAGMAVVGADDRTVVSASWLGASDPVWRDQQAANPLGVFEWDLAAATATLAYEIEAVAALAAGADGRFALSGTASGKLCSLVWTPRRDDGHAIEERWSRISMGSNGNALVVLPKTIEWRNPAGTAPPPVVALRMGSSVMTNLDGHMEGFKEAADDLERVEDLDAERALAVTRLCATTTVRKNGRNRLRVLSSYSEWSLAPGGGRLRGLALGPSGFVLRASPTLFLLVRSFGSTLTGWDLSRGAARWTVDDPSIRGWNPRTLAISPDRRLVASAYGGRLRVWWTEDGAPAGVASCNMAAGSLAFTPDSSSLVVGFVHQMTHLAYVASFPMETTRSTAVTSPPTPAIAAPAATPRTKKTVSREEPPPPPPEPPPPLETTIPASPLAPWSDGFPTPDGFRLSVAVQLDGRPEVGGLFSGPERSLLVATGEGYRVLRSDGAITALPDLRSPSDSKTYPVLRGQREVDELTIHFGRAQHAVWMRDGGIWLVDGSGLTRLDPAFRAGPRIALRERVTAIAVDPAESRLAVGMGATILQFTLPDLDPLDPLTGHEAVGTALAVDSDLRGRSVRVAQPVRTLAFSADGTTLFSGAADGTHRRWDLATGESVILANHPSLHVVAVRTVPGNRILEATASGTVTLRDRDGVAAWQFPLGPRLKLGWVKVRGASVSPDGLLVALAPESWQVRLVHTASGADATVFPLDGLPARQPFTGARTPTDFAGRASAVTFLTGGSLAFGTDTGEILVFERT